MQKVKIQVSVNIYAALRKGSSYGVPLESRLALVPCTLNRARLFGVQDLLLIGSAASVFVPLPDRVQPWFLICPSNTKIDCFLNLKNPSKKSPGAPFGSLTRAGACIWTQLRGVNQC
jgi:hypothetical protein